MFGARLTIYMRIRRHWLSVRAIGPRGGIAQVEGLARAASREARGSALEVVAVGEEATALEGVEGVTIHDAFCHPRVIIGGFDAAQLVAGGFLRQICAGGNRWLRFRLIIHPQDDLEGGLTDIEERALKELGLRLGASRVIVYQGAAELGDDALVALGALPRLDSAPPARL